MPGKPFVLTVLLILFGSALTVVPLDAQSEFRRPAGKRAAISLTFDDGRLGQIDYGIDFGHPDA